MPFKTSHLGYLDEHPVTGAEIEPSGAFYYQVSNSGGQYDTGADNSFSSAKKTSEHAVGELDQVDDQDGHEPLVELGGVDDEEGPVHPVQKVGAVEHLEVSATPDHGQGANKDDRHDEDEDHPGDVSVPPWHPKDAGHGCKDPMNVTPFFAISVR